LVFFKNGAKVTSNSTPIIAILGGTGKEGTGLALRWASAGYTILIGSRQAEKAQAAAGAINSQLGFDRAAAKADLCVLTVFQEAHQSAIESLREELKGKILVDTTARVDFRNPKPPTPPSAGRTAQSILGPDVRVVAAFQNVPAHTLKKKLGGKLDADVLVCADDQPAAKQVMQIAEAGGMNAYYAGDLDVALVVEGLTAILINLNKYYGVKTASIAVTGLKI
jgi:NADPH-dependent F420 reductase